MPPLHLRAAAEADLDRRGARNGAHRVTVVREEDGYDDPAAPWPRG